MADVDYQHERTILLQGNRCVAECDTDVTSDVAETLI
jgi:hypothetical protein